MKNEMIVKEDRFVNGNSGTYSKEAAEIKFVSHR
jgi:hypothetical protein